MERTWIIPERNHDKDLEQILLENRGICDPHDREEFISARPLMTYDPFYMKDMEQAARRIMSAIANRQHICIYGDYDCDGICAISLLIDIFSKLGARISHYIPSRFEEGYGLNKDAIANIRNNGADMIVTVDCGSVSFEEVEYAKELGLDIIVTDHHNVDKKAARCLLINPKQESCPYPERELSGCGVAFKLAQALQRISDQMLTKADLNRVLDLVAIATVGDIVPLTGENRTMVKYGINELNRCRRPGLKMLIDRIGLKTGEIKAENIAYVIVPHLNAAGRLSSAETGVTLMTSKDENELDLAVKELVDNNKERRKMQEEAFAKAVSIVEELHREDLFLVVNVPDAHEGIAGIIAGKIKDSYYRPTIMVTPISEKELKGTGRSIDGINIYELLSENNKLFKKFGGHTGACGFLMDNSNLNLLRDSLITKAKSIYESDSYIFSPKLIIDAEIEPEECDSGLMSILEKMEPYGHKNQKPIFCMRNLIPEQPVYLGDRQQHVRFAAAGLTCIIFQLADKFRAIHYKGCSVDLVGCPEINRWNGTEKIQFVVTDIRCYNE